MLLFSHHMTLLLLSPFLFHAAVAAIVTNCFFLNPHWQWQHPNVAFVVCSVSLQIEEGGFHCASTHTDVHSLLQSVVRQGLSYLLPGVSCTLSCKPALNGSVDPKRLAQIVTNGLSNASKFTTTGSVAVTAAFVVASGRRYLVVDIANTGSGLQHPSWKYFVPFRKALQPTHSQETNNLSSCNSTCTTADTYTAFGPKRSLNSTGSRPSSCYRNASAHCYPSSCQCRRRREHRRVAAYTSPVSDAGIHEFTTAWKSTMRLQGTGALPQPEVMSAGKGQHSRSPTVSTGIGLPLSRGLAQACNGWLGLDDDADHVTHFWLVIPVPVDDASSPSETAASKSDVVLTIPDTGTAREVHHDGPRTRMDPPALVARHDTQDASDVVVTKPGGDATYPIGWDSDAHAVKMSPGHGWDLPVLAFRIVVVEGMALTVPADGTDISPSLSLPFF
jgi:hypothetical protein